MLSVKTQSAMPAFNDCSLGMSPGRPGTVLRHAREAMGVTLAEVAQHTRIAERHLEAIELGLYDEIVAVIYAVGFARNYARFVGVAEAGIADAVRAEYNEMRVRPRWR